MAQNKHKPGGTSKEEQVAVPAGPETSAQPKEVAFSVRLTTEEHELLKKAAALRGWTPTNLIRTATLERAAHILNTSRVTTFNFKELAVRLSDQLFKPREVEVDPEDLEHAPPDWIPTATAHGLPVDVLSELRKANRLGGGEFLALVLEYCEGLTASRRFDVPAPIEPPTPTA